MATLKATTGSPTVTTVEVTLTVVMAEPLRLAVFVICVPGRVLEGTATTRLVTKVPPALNVGNVIVRGGVVPPTTGKTSVGMDPLLLVIGPNETKVVIGKKQSATSQYYRC